MNKTIIKFRIKSLCKIYVIFCVFVIEKAPSDSSNLEKVFGIKELSSCKRASNMFHYK